MLLVGIDHTVLNVYDEGIIAHGAQRVLDGDVPYKDFWELYGPAQFWILAALYKLFGTSLLTERVWDTFIRAMIALFSYLLANRLVPQPLAVVAWVLSLAWLWVIGCYGFPLLPALLFIMIGAYFFIAFLSEPAKTRLLFFAGLATAASASFRHDIGAYAMFAEVALLLVQNFKSANGNTSDGIPAGSGFVRNLCSFGLGAGLVGVPVVVYLLSKVPISNLWEQFFIYPATIYTSMRYLPYPSILKPFRIFIRCLNGVPIQFFWESFVYTIPFYFHFFILIAAALVLTKSWFMERRSGSGFWDCKKLSILFLVILISLEFLKSLIRPGLGNLSHVIVLSLVLSVVILHRVLTNSGKAAGILVGISLIAMAVYPTHRFVIDGQRQLPPGCNGPARAWEYIIPTDQAAAIRFIQEHVPEDQKIFVGNGRHDKVSINDAMFYFLAERRSATMFDCMAPGQVTTAKVQNSIIKELIHNRVQYVVLVTKWDKNADEPNKSAESTKVKLLDNFILSEYSPIMKRGGYTICKKTSMDTKPSLEK